MPARYLITGEEMMWIRAVCKFGLSGGIALVGTTMAMPATASDQSGTVIWYAADIANGPYAFLMTGARTAKPACATDDTWSIPKANAEAAKVLLAGVMSARAGNRTLAVTGTGLCDPDQPAREKVQYILFY